MDAGDSRAWAHAEASATNGQPYLLTPSLVPTEIVPLLPPRLWSALNGESVALQSDSATRVVERLRRLAASLTTAEPNATDGVAALRRSMRAEAGAWEADAKRNTARMLVQLSPQLAAAGLNVMMRRAPVLFGQRWTHMAGCSTMRQLFSALQLMLRLNSSSAAGKNDTCWASPRWQQDRDYNFLLACRTQLGAAHDTRDARTGARLSYSWKDVAFGWGDAQLWARWAAERALPDVLVVNSGIHQFHYEPDFDYSRRGHLYKHGGYRRLWLAHYANQTAMLLQAVELLREMKRETSNRSLCVVWKANNVQPAYDTHMDVLNELTIPAMLGAGVGVADPSAVTKANTKTPDVHHHDNIFQRQIFLPFLAALDQLCPPPITTHQRMDASGTPSNRQHHTSHSSAGRGGPGRSGRHRTSSNITTIRQAHHHRNNSAASS